MFSSSIPYCGTPPDPAQALTRFNVDPLLIVALIALATAQLCLYRRTSHRASAAVGWAVAAAALISPLCAMSVSLFSARITQHMILLLVAAPLIAAALPRKGTASSGQGIRLASSLFFLTLWFWHMPRPYAATFTSSVVYWLMHISLSGSAIWLWRELLHHSPEHTAEALIAGLLSSMQMGLLGAVLAFAGHPLFEPHFLTAPLWGLSALQDQQLGGLVMWVPGIALFLWAAVRSLRRMWAASEESSTA